MSKHEATGDTVRIYERLRIGEVSLVDDPGCPGADVVIVKRKDQSSNADQPKALDETQDWGQPPANDEQMRAEIRKRLAPMITIRKQLADGDLDIGAFRRVSAVILETMQSDEGGDDRVSKQATAMASSVISETEMNLKEIEDALAQAETRIDEVAAENVVLKARAEKAEADLETVRKARAPGADAAAAEADDEEVLKSLPAHLADVVRKARADTKAADERAALAAAALDAETTKVEKSRRVDQLKAMGLVGDAERIADAMIEVAKAKPDAAKVIDDALKAAAKAVQNSAVFKSFGSATADFDGDPEEVLKARVRDVKAKDAALTDEAAYSKAIEENPAIYDAYLAKRRAAAVN
jgi:hypothetical protein